MIQQISSKDGFVTLAKVLNEAFGTVAKEFGLTIENCLTNSAFITSDELKAQLTDNREFYIYRLKNEIVGFVAIEQSVNEADTCYIEKLAVLPAYRHAGIGRQLMDFASNRIAESGSKRISIALINSNVILKKWYSKQGFTETLVKVYEHLPFDVCFMEKHIVNL